MALRACSERMHVAHAITMRSAEASVVIKSLWRLDCRTKKSKRKKGSATKYFYRNPALLVQCSGAKPLGWPFEPPRANIRCSATCFIAVTAHHGRAGRLIRYGIMASNCAVPTLVKVTTRELAIRFAQP